jgi:hypothetical protein
MRTGSANSVKKQINVSCFLKYPARFRRGRPSDDYPEIIRILIIIVKQDSTVEGDMA